MISTEIFSKLYRKIKKCIFFVRKNFYRNFTILRRQKLSDIPDEEDVIEISAEHLLPRIIEGIIHIMCQLPKAYFCAVVNK